MPSDRNLLTVSRPELLVDGSDRRFRGLLYDLFAFGRALEAARLRFAETIGLTPTQYLALIAVSQASASEPAGVGEIARRLHLSGAFVTIEINKLVAEGFVEKRPHPKDRRRVRVTLTAAGADRLAELAVLQRPVNDALFGMLSADDFATLAELLAKLVTGSEGALSLADHLASSRSADLDQRSTNRARLGRK